MGRLTRALPGVLLGMLAIGPVGTVGSAAMAPAYERQRELMAVIQDPNVVARIGVIERIEAGAPHTFRLWSAKCVLDVAVVSELGQEPIAGGGPLRVSAGAPQCR